MEKQRDGQSVREHQHYGGANSRDVSAAKRERGDPEENRAHVHHGRIRNHLFEIALNHRNQADYDDISDCENEDHVCPEIEPRRQKCGADLDQSVEPEFFQNARVQHRNWRWRGRISVGRPRMKREKRNENSEAEKHEPENRICRSRGEKIFAAKENSERCEIKRNAARERRNVKPNEPGERNHRAESQINRHRYRGLFFRVPAPKQDRDKRRDQRKFVENVKRENVHRSEKPEKPGLNEKQRRKIQSRHFDIFRENRAQPSGQADDRRHREKRERNSVQAELKPKPNFFDANSAKFGNERVAAFSERFLVPEAETKPHRDQKWREKSEKRDRLSQQKRRLFQKEEQNRRCQRRSDRNL